VEEEEKEEEEDDDDFSKRGGRPREGEEWPDKEDVSRDTVDITNLVNKWTRPNLVRMGEKSLGSQSWGRKNTQLRQSSEMKTQRHDTMETPIYKAHGPQNAKRQSNLNRWILQI